MEDRRKSQKNNSSGLPSDSAASIQSSQYKPKETETLAETTDAANGNRVNPTIQAGNAAIVAALIGKPNSTTINNTSTGDFINQYPDGLTVPKSPILRKTHMKKTNDNEAYMQDLDSDSDCDVNEMTAREGDSSGIESSGCYTFLHSSSYLSSTH